MHVCMKERERDRERSEKILGGNFSLLSILWHAPSENSDLESSSLHRGILLGPSLVPCRAESISNCRNHMLCPWLLCHMHLILLSLPSFLVILSPFCALPPFCLWVALPLHLCPNLTSLAISGFHVSLSKVLTLPPLPASVSVAGQTCFKFHTSLGSILIKHASFLPPPTSTPSHSFLLLPIPPPHYTPCQEKLCLRSP